jgi:hypothetical protein
MVLMTTTAIRRPHAERTAIYVAAIEDADRAIADADSDAEDRCVAAAEALRAAIDLRGEKHGYGSTPNGGGWTVREVGNVVEVTYEPWEEPFGTAARDRRDPLVAESLYPEQVAALARLVADGRDPLPDVAADLIRSLPEA